MSYIIRVYVLVVYLSIIHVAVLLRTVLLATNYELLCDIYVKPGVDVNAFTACNTPLCNAFVIPRAALYMISAVHHNAGYVHKTYHTGEVRM